MDKVDRKCPVCGDAIIGREDKKYCSEQCRNDYNNKINRQTEQVLLATNKALRKNRSILRTLCPFGKATVRREVLVAMGYDASCFTSMFLTNSKQLYYLCYDYGFSPILERGIEKVLIISRQQYMQSWNPWDFVKDQWTN